MADSMEPMKQLDEDAAWKRQMANRITTRAQLESYVELSDDERALVHLRRGFEITKETLGPQHPEVATYLGNLGAVFSSIGALQVALDCKQRALEIYKERFADVSDFLFTIVGNFDESELEPLVETWLASLPGCCSTQPLPVIGSAIKGSGTVTMTPKRRFM